MTRNNHNPVQESCLMCLYDLRMCRDLETVTIELLPVRGDVPDSHTDEDFVFIQRLRGIDVTE